MNCKPGDLAVVIRARGTPELLGHIVSVIRPWIGPTTDNHFAWECEYPGPKNIPQSWSDGSHTLEKTRPIADECLRPIRDSDGEDETLRYAGKPANYKGKVVTAKPVTLESL